MTTPVMLPQMTQEQQATFNMYYPSTQRDEIVGVLLAVLLGKLRRASLLFKAQRPWSCVPGAFLDRHSGHPGNHRGVFHAGSRTPLQCGAGDAACLLCGAGRDAAASSYADGGLCSLRDGAECRRAVLRAVRAADDVTAARQPPWTRLKARTASTMRLMMV